MQAAIVALRRHVPVVGVIAGMVGCFGGMSLAAALCSYLVVTKQGRLGMNGPEVIEQEAGIDGTGCRRPAPHVAVDRRRSSAWRVGARGHGSWTTTPRTCAPPCVAAFVQGVPAAHRSEQVDAFLQRLARIDPASVTPESMREVYPRSDPSATSQSRKEQA